MTKITRLWICAIAAVISFAGTVQVAAAAEKVRVGAIGSASPLSWPFFIALHQNLFMRAGLEFEMSYTSSAPGLLQELSAGSLDIAMSTGLVDPIRATLKGGPVAIVLVEVQSAPYVLMAHSDIKMIAALKGKTVAVGGFNDLTNIYLDRMLAPSGLNRSEVDMKFFGNTPARFAALKAGAVDAAMLSPPANFYGEAAGYSNLGIVKDYAGDLPFSGAAVNTRWAASHRDGIGHLIDVYRQSVSWFDDEDHRSEAIGVMVEASHGNPDDIGKSYDFLRKGDYFNHSGAVSRSKLTGLEEALHRLGDIDQVIPIERLVLPDLVKLSD